MEWLNYHLLLYFWVARERSVTKACQQLRLATETGRIVYRYTEEIFSLGRELQDTIKHRPTGRAVEVVVGVADSLPKLIVHRLLEPLLRRPEDVEVTCYDGDSPFR